MKPPVNRLLACCLTLGVFAAPGLACADDASPAVPTVKVKPVVKKTGAKKGAKPTGASLLLPQPEPLDAGLAVTPTKKTTMPAPRKESPLPTGTASPMQAASGSSSPSAGITTAVATIPLPPPRPTLLAKFDTQLSTTEDDLQTASIPVSGPLGVRVDAETLTRQTPETSTGTPSSVDALISKHAQRYGLPESLLRRVVKRESGGNPGLRHGPYLGLMQMRLDTARGMGYSGGPQGLLDANTSLTYGAAYLANAWRVSGGNPDRAVSLYASGYYYEAKRKGMLPKLIKGMPAK
jgi:soluble lytic murein transglycosylase-like protein